MVNLISDATIRKTATLSCDSPCIVLPELNWELNLTAISDTIVFIDEDHPALVQGQQLSKLMMQSDNCYVIITRDKMPWIPYSYQEIYKIKTSGKFHFLEPVYSKMDIFKENEKIIGKTSSDNWNKISKLGRIFYRVSYSDNYW